MNNNKNRYISRCFIGGVLAPLIGNMLKKAPTMWGLKIENNELLGQQGDLKIEIHELVGQRDEPKTEIHELVDQQGKLKTEIHEL